MYGKTRINYKDLMIHCRARVKGKQGWKISSKDVETNNANLKRECIQGFDEHETPRMMLVIRGKGCNIPLIPQPKNTKYK